MTLDLLPKPKRFLIFGRWILIKECSCDVGCSGHIMPFDSVYETGIFLQPFIIDYEQWNIVCEQEFRAHEALVNLPKKVKNKYTPKPKLEQKTGGSSGKGFGPRY